MCIQPSQHTKKHHETLPWRNDRNPFKIESTSSRPSQPKRRHSRNRRCIAVIDVIRAYLNWEEGDEDLLDCLELSLHDTRDAAHNWARNPTLIPKHGKALCKFGPGTQISSSPIMLMGPDKEVLQHVRIPKRTLRRTIEGFGYEADHRHAEGPIEERLVCLQRP